MAIIYGVDTENEVTPLMVRDAMLECFYNAHCTQSDLSDNQNPSTNREYCKAIVSKAFDDTNGDFENPSKDSIMSAAKWLTEFSRSFRDQETIMKHFGDISVLIARLK